MSIDIAKAIFRKLATNGVIFNSGTFRSVKATYYRVALDFIESYRNDAAINGLHLVESWIVEGEQDKSRMYGLEVPVGTWMVSMKVENDAIWEKFVKEGSVKGFSIEGYFANKFELSQQKPITSDLELLTDIEKELAIDYLKNRITSKD